AERYLGILARLVDGRPASFYRTRGKRLLDIAVSSIALVLLTPLMLATAIVIRLSMGSPVFFRQPRPGLGGRTFTILKFRTMSVPAPGTPDAARLTALGRWLRALSVDELPELLNVLRGDMSLVGPRPLLTQYLARYTPQQARRHDVPPGITGWAQVNGRNTLSWEEKFQRDVWYVDHCSLALDGKILARTAWKIVTREGIAEPGHATAREFMGSARP